MTLSKLRRLGLVDAGRYLAEGLISRVRLPNGRRAWLVNHARTALPGETGASLHRERNEMMRRGYRAVEANHEQRMERSGTT